jgi:hypothetical protein
MNSHLSTHRKSLGALALVVALFGLGVAFDGDAMNPSNDAPPVANTNAIPAPPPAAEEESPEPTQVDVSRQDFSEDIVLNWSERGCTHARNFQIRFRGEDPTHALVLVLKNGYIAPDGRHTEIPENSQILSSSTIEFTYRQRLTLARWFSKVRELEPWGSTTTVSLAVYRVERQGGGRVLEQEFINDYSGFGIAYAWMDSVRDTAYQVVEKLPPEEANFDYMKYLESRKKNEATLEATSNQ